jgi:uncharacterized protein YoxC
VLEDPLWSAGSPLRDELLHSLKDGAVAARVHVGGEAWIVVKPWQYQKQYRASRRASWKQVARGEVPNEHAMYVEALQTFLVDCLPVNEFPGSQQPIQWYQILAWCSRDQNARYQSYYQWRAEGVGFSLPAKSPATLVQVVLGLLSDASTLRALEKTDRELRTTEAELAELRRQPADLLVHVRRQLLRQLNALDRTPFRQNGLFEHPNLLALAKQRHAGYEGDLALLENERQGLAGQQEALLERRTPLRSGVDLLRNQVDQVEAVIAGDLERVEELQNEASSLQQRLATRCDAGNVLLKDCNYVDARIKQVRFERFQGVAKHQQSKQHLEQELRAYRERLNQLESECKPFDTQLAEIAARSRDLAQRNANVLQDIQRLRDVIEDYELYESVVEGRASWGKIAETERRLRVLQRKSAQLEAKLQIQRRAFRERRKAVSDWMQRIAKALPRFDWGVFNDDEQHRARPFRLGPMHSTTYGVLETLAGDLACLLDSSNKGSFHPGILIHDSPREAEMNEEILWALLSMVSLETHDHLQYIVTTSTRVEQKFGRFVRLALGSSKERDLLFRNRIGVEERPLPV